MSEQPTWRLTDEAMDAAIDTLWDRRGCRQAADAQAKALVMWFSRQLFDPDNMDESLNMINGVIVGPRWLVQLRKDVGLP